MGFDETFANFETLTQKDLKLNFFKFFRESELTPKEAGLIALACAESVNCKPLIQASEAHLKEQGASPEEILEAKDAAAIMGLLNTYYRFRHMVKKDAYSKPAGLRMNVMARPVNGKQNFEMMALAVSILNGCENCISSHEKSLVDLGVSEEKIHDLARLAAVTKALELSFRQTGS